MFEKIIAFSLKNKALVLLMIAALILAGIISLRQIAIDAVPDITNNQVQIVTTSPNLAAEEIEKFITFPVEVSLSNIQNVKEVRSVSRYGLSVVTVVFSDDFDNLKARQLVAEQLMIVKDEIPTEFGIPQMMPITTGLGEIYQYIIQVKSGYEKKYSTTELRSIQDWIIKRQLAGLKGISEVSSFGGQVKQYEVGVNPLQMLSYNITISEVEHALRDNNNNSGGSYIEKDNFAFYIRTDGRVESLEDIENIIVKNETVPVKIKDIAKVRFGSSKRYGAITMDGKGEVVGGITLMLKGANSSDAVKNVSERMKQIQKSMPEGLEIYPYIDRSKLVSKTINTVTKNLIEGGLIVIFVLVLILGNLRAGLIVSSVIPLSMLFAIILMNYFDVSANLMSLGAIDFGIVVDGAVIIVEGILHTLHSKHKGNTLSQEQMNHEIHQSSSQIYSSASFGVLIILVVFIPIFTLEGIEGKTFLPMAQTVSFAIIGSLLLSVTYVPVVSSLVLKKHISNNNTFSDKISNKIQQGYLPLLTKALNHPKKVLATTLLIFIVSIISFSFMGSEFIPTLEEGDLAMQMSVEPGSSLEKSIETTTKAEQLLKQNFSEIIHVVSKIGTAEVPTDPMAIEDADVMILLKEKEEWENATTREELVSKIKEKLSVIEKTSFEFSQPIQLRFNELMTGAKTDIAIQIFGEDVKQLKTLADKTAQIIKNINGIGDVKVEQTEGLKQLSVVINRNKLALHQVNVDDVNKTIQAAYGGANTGLVFENERHFDLVVRMDSLSIQNLSLAKLMVAKANGKHIPLSEVADIKESIAPMQISREDAKRRITIGVNVRDRDVASLVGEIQNKLDSVLRLPPGYTIKYGGQFENLQNAIDRLKLVVPVTLLSILVLLFIAFKKTKESLIIFMAVPLATIGGIFSLMLRGMPFSISAAIGFIALFGVAVLNGIVLISEFIRLREKLKISDIKELIITGTSTRLRPVLMTALVASIGFLPMALATSNGAEVQRPLATVVIGGLITSTFLTLFILPILYFLIFNTKKSIPSGFKSISTLLITGLCFVNPIFGQEKADLESFVKASIENNISIKNNTFELKKWENEKNNPYTIQPFQVGVQYGQNDGKTMDTYVEVMQDIGSPWSIGIKKRHAQLGIDFANQKSKSIEREIRYNITSEYYNWIFNKNVLNILTQVSEVLVESEKKNLLVLESGEIDNTGFLIIKQLNNTILQKIQHYSSQLVHIEQNLEYQTRIKAVPKDTLMVVLPVQTGLELSPTLYSENELKINLLKQENAVLKAGNLPTIQLGYFNQTLDKVSGHQGIKGGLAIPLIFGANRKEIALNRLNIDAALASQSDIKRQLTKELEIIVRNIQLFEKLNFKQGNQLNYDNLGIKNLQQKLNTGEINAFEFIKYCSILIDGSIGEMEMINQYNQNIIKYNFLTAN